MKLNKVRIILPFFYNGGVERWASYVAKGLSYSSYDVELIVIGKAHKNPIDFGVDLKLKHCSFFDLFKMILDDDVLVLTALTKLNFLLSFVSFFSGKKNVITSVHLSLSKKTHESFLKFLLRKFFHKLIINFSNHVICVSDGVKSELSNIQNSNNIVRIYNPCFSVDEISLEKIPLRNVDGSIKFVSAGRLHRQKRFDVLIRAFCNAYNFLPNGSSLTIYGEGDEYNDLLKLINDFDASSYIFLNGFSDCLINEFKFFNVFVLSSDYEGFGNVLVEALSVGLNCISFDIPHGPKEILNNGEFGVLIPHTEEDLTNFFLSLNDDSFPIFDQNKCFDHLLQFTDMAFANNYSSLVENFFLPKENSHI